MSKRKLDISKYPFRAWVSGIDAWIYLSARPGPKDHFDIHLRAEKAIDFHKVDVSFGEIEVVEANPKYKP